MPYVIDRFGATYAAAEELPRLSGRQPQGAGAVDSSNVRLVGGHSFDWRGSDAADIPVEKITIQGEWVASSAGGMEAKLAALRALRGVRSKLWRTSGATSQWRTARCLSVDSELGVGSPSWAEISMGFELGAEPWSGTAGSTSVTLAASPQTATIGNDGNATVRAITVNVHPTTSAITVVTLENLTAGHVSKIKYVGTIAATQSLSIACESRSVKNNGTDDYDGLSLESAHTINEWLRLAPGDNAIRITTTGGGVKSTVGFVFYDGYA
jgi:hypothetical protein